jgi:drug/metabolite transporter (DMT)-like permease
LPPSKLRVHAALLTVSLLFGANFVFTKIILGALPARVWVLFRIAAASVLLVPLAMHFGWRRPSLRLCLLLGLASLLGVALNQVLFTEGLRLTSPEHSAVITACIPTWTMLIAVLVRQERLNRWRVLALVLALAGVQCLLGVDRLFAAGQPLDRDQLVGDLLTVANGVSFAAHLVLMRRIGAGNSPWVSTALMFLWATAMVGVYSGPEVTAAHWQTLASPPIVWLAAYAVLFSTVLTYALNTWALQHTHSSQVALYINVQPLVAASIQMLRGEPVPGPRFFVALLLVFGGLWLQTRAE